ncbi:MAG: TauD/TfdA family dioxygenase [Alphaproteobacteria bacterium]|jgi:alpha-ketoglutarate-dependent taurine dioxygenase|nr:TauD/TfdA family dioxygenase [Alphaproteobacteria bacterium]
MVVDPISSKGAEALRVTERHPLLGAEVRGLDLSRPLDAATVAAILEIWARHLVLVFPEQELSEAAQVRFSRYFGELAVHQDPEKISARVPEIFRVANVDEDGNLLPEEHELRRYFRVLTGLWHTDGSYKDMPSHASVLHGLEVPPEGGETWYANMFAAYEALPEAVKKKIQGRQMVHSHDLNRIICPGLTPTTEQQKRDLPPMTHPLVRTHADGRKSLFISENVAYYVGGMPLEEGKALHRQLMELATRPEFVYRHKWQAGDVVMWDNRATLHRVTEYDGRKYRRVLQRTEILGQEVVV